MTSTSVVESADTVLRPLPPPPRPQPRPSVRSAFASPSLSLAARARPRRVSGASAAFEQDEDGIIAPQPAPQPHAHPLAALSDGGWRRNRLAGSRPPPPAKRLHPAFLNPERVTAFLDKENADPSLIEDDAPDEDRERGDAAPQLLSSRFLQRRIRDVAAESAPIAAELLDDEKVRAATDASHWRHELHPLPLLSTVAGREDAAVGDDSALERARVRRVRKQVDPKWLQRQRDAANRPRAPLERDDELHLRERLVTTSVNELVTTGVLFDDDDAERLVAFDPVRWPALPIYSSGTTGLPGCCYDSWSL